MLVKLKKELDNGHTTIPAGKVIEVSEPDAQKLISEGVAEAAGGRGFAPDAQKPEHAKK